MSTRTAHLNGSAPRRTSRARTAIGPGAGRMWPAMIVGLISLNASIVAVTVFFAFSDKSVATEPDYYTKALNYNDTILQRATNQRLAWRLTPSLRPASDGRSIELAASLADRDGAPIAGARIETIAFASVRSGARQQLQLAASRAPGEYTAPIRIDRPGQWYLRFTVVSGADTFTRETTLLVPDFRPTSATH
jgi:nitrogen fixation protein FixH